MVEALLGLVEAWKGSWCLGAYCLFMGDLGLEMKVR